MPTIKQKFKQTDQLLCAVCHALSDFCLLYNWTEFKFRSTGSRLVIPIVTVYHFYCNSGFLIPRICNIFSMLVPRQDLSIKINQDQLKNYYISFFSLPANSKPNVLFFVYDPKVLFWPEGPFLWLWPGGPFFDQKALFWPEGPVFWYDPKVLFFVLDPFYLLQF